ncbi:MAG: SRPBCC domain-containing protein [Phycisphaeraceae bacterium]
MTTLAPDQIINADLTVEINAPVEKVFASLLHMLGPGFADHEGNSLKMKLEARPGGRWFRDLGNDEGHLWGHVQVIKKNRLVEIYGPLFMSYPVASHIQFRVTAKNRRTTLSLRHQAIGMIPDDHRKGVGEGWKHTLQGVREHAERQ